MHARINAGRAPESLPAVKDMVHRWTRAALHVFGADLGGMGWTDSRAPPGRGRAVPRGVSPGTEYRMLAGDRYAAFDWSGAKRGDPCSTTREREWCSVWGELPPGTASHAETPGEDRAPPAHLVRYVRGYERQGGGTIEQKRAVRILGDREPGGTSARRDSGGAAPPVAAFTRKNSHAVTKQRGPIGRTPNSHDSEDDVIETQSTWISTSRRRSILPCSTPCFRSLVRDSGIPRASCGSESNDLALKGLAFARRGARNHIIISAVEHPAVTQHRPLPCEARLHGHHAVGRCLRPR